MPNIIMPGASAILTAAPNLFEIRDGRLRLRPHDPAVPASLCDCAFGPLVPLAAPLSTARLQYPELALGSTWQSLGSARVAGILTGSDAAQLAATGTTMIELAAVAAQRNVNVFTVEIMITLPAAFTSRIVASEDVTAAVGQRRWAVTIVNATTVRLTTYNAAGSPTLFNLTTRTLVAGDRLVFVVACSYPNGYLQVYDHAAGVSLGSVTGSIAQMPSVAAMEEHPNLLLTGNWTAAGLPTLCPPSATIHYARRYDAYRASGPTGAITAAPLLFDLTNTGAKFRFEVEYNGGVWDASVFDVDDPAQWAANVGDPGWHIAGYEVSNNPTGVYGGGPLSLADFQALGLLTDTGKYLDIYLTCISDGYTQYPLVWMLIAESSPTMPRVELSNFTRTGDAGTVDAQPSLGSTLEVGDIIYIYAISALNGVTYLIGSGTVVNPLLLNVVLDYSAVPDYNLDGEAVPSFVACFGVVSRGGLLGLPGTLGGPNLISGAVTIDSVVLDADLLGATVTVSGPGATDPVLIYWSDTAMNVAGFTGPGAHHVAGLSASYAFTPAALTVNDSGQIAKFMSGELRGTGSHPHSDPKRGPHSRGE